MTGFHGAFGEVLEAVRAIVDGEKAALGLAEVRIGERRRGWGNPSCFIMLGPGGTPVRRASGRRHVNEHVVNVRILVITKKIAESDDARVLDILERIADVLDGAAPIGGCHDHEFPNPATVAPSLITEGGDYETMGALDVALLKEVERKR